MAPATPDCHFDPYIRNVSYCATGRRGKATGSYLVLQVVGHRALHAFLGLEYPKSAGGRRYQGAVTGFDGKETGLAIVRSREIWRDAGEKRLFTMAG